MKKVLMEVKHISKSFGPTKALVDVSIPVYGGEICGLIGENGSGKSTLSSIIAGIQRADSGEMIKDGQPYAPGTSVEGQARGVAMIVQEVGSIPNITIADNIFAGKEKAFCRGPFVNKRAMNAAAGEALRKIGVTNMRPEASLNTLNSEDRKLVEIARAMYNEPDILIVDETTTALSKRGREVIYDVIRKMRDEGRGVLFISHDIGELIEVCDSLVVLRDGQYVARLEKDRMEPDIIKSMMIGREVKGNYYREDNDGWQDAVAMEARGITGKGGIVKDVSFSLHKGEILGIGGLSESGMHEVGRMAFGIEPIVDGEIVLENGEKITSSAKAVRQHIGYVSKNRDVEALSLAATVKDNIALPSLYKIRKFGLVSKKKEKEIALQQVETLRIKCAGIEQNVNSLSGGNKQKVVFGKWIGNEADILILDCPTRGVDVGVKASMYQLMYQLKKEGKAILMISEELPELIGMSDRILIMKDGRVEKEFLRGPEATEQNIINYMI